MNENFEQSSEEKRDQLSKLQVALVRIFFDRWLLRSSKMYSKASPLQHLQNAEFEDKEMTALA